MAAPHSFPDLATAKRAARERALAARAGCDAAQSAAGCAAAGVALAAHVLRECPPPPGAVVSGFWPMDGEIDIRPLLQALHARGHPIVLPVTPPRGNPLIFRIWRPGDVLQPERFGTFPPGRRARPCRTSCWCRCWRSTGAATGWATAPAIYDRTLAALPPGRYRARLSRYAAQEVDAVPVGPNDVALDAVATERGIIRLEENLNAHPVPRRRGRPHRPRDGGGGAARAARGAAHRSGGRQRRERLARLRPGARHGARRCSPPART